MRCHKFLLGAFFIIQNKGANMRSSRLKIIPAIFIVINFYISYSQNLTLGAYLW
jgi:hypothetical protein